MARRVSPDELTTPELRQLLRERQRAAAQQRLARLNGEGRIIELADAPSPPDAAEWAAVVEQTTTYYGRPAVRRRRLDQALFLIELLALIGLGFVAVRLWQTNRALNDDLAALREAQVAEIARLQAQTQQTATAAAEPAAAVIPIEVNDPAPAFLIPVVTPALAATAVPAATEPILTPTAVKLGGLLAPSGVNAPVVLPGGHQPPQPGEEPQPGEAGELPNEILPALLAYEPLPTPAAGAELALRIRIPAIGVDSPVVQGDSWDQLKLGVGQFIGSANPGQTGNVVLSAHNDIYGEIFRHLERLAPGNEIIISTASRDYTYVVDDARIVAPTDVWVMAPTEHAQVTLISCFPYRINTHRIAIMAHLVDTPS